MHFSLPPNTDAGRQHNHQSWHTGQRWHSSRPQSRMDYSHHGSRPQYRMDCNPVYGRQGVVKHQQSFHGTLSEPQRIQNGNPNVPPHPLPTQLAWDRQVVKYAHSNGPFVQFRAHSVENDRVEPYPFDSTKTSAQRTEEMLTDLRHGRLKRVVVQPLQQTLSNNQVSTREGQSDAPDHRLTACHGCCQYLVQGAADTARQTYPFLIFIEPATGASAGYFFHIDCFDALYDAHLLLPNFLHLEDAVPNTENRWGLMIRLWFATAGHFDIAAVHNYLLQHEAFEADLAAIIQRRIKDPSGAQLVSGELCKCSAIPVHPVLDPRALRYDRAFKLSDVLRYEECSKMAMPVRTKIMRPPPGLGLGMHDVVMQDFSIPLQVLCQGGQLDALPAEKET